MRPRTNPGSGADRAFIVKHVRCPRAGTGDAPQAGIETLSRYSIPITRVTRHARIEPLGKGDALAGR
jgi:hypothetical protein